MDTRFSLLALPRLTGLLLAVLLPVAGPARQRTGIPSGPLYPGEARDSLGVRVNELGLLSSYADAITVLD